MRDAPFGVGAAGRGRAALSHFPERPRASGARETPGSARASLRGLGVERGMSRGLRANDRRAARRAQHLTDPLRGMEPRAPELPTPCTVSPSDFSKMQKLQESPNTRFPDEVVYLTHWHNLT